MFATNFSDTALHVAWTGTLRVYGCTQCCKGWYFTFIDGAVYLGAVASQDPHRVRHIEGHCNNIPKGNVRMGFRVGNCRGYEMRMPTQVGIQSRIKFRQQNRISRRAKAL